jgi:hypothetical protein
MKIKTLCSLTIIPTLILILLLITSVDNYIPENQIYGQTILGDRNGHVVHFINIDILSKEKSNIEFPV